MKEKIDKYDCGIICGRFQTHELHSAHKDLIRTVIDKHPRILLFLGLSPLRNTLTNPLDFRCRKAAILEEFPSIEIYYIDDVMIDDMEESDKIWSKNLDSQIKKWLHPTQTALLYGSRDSFISHYKGKYATCELEPELFISGTEVRRQVMNNYPPTKDYRAGLIASTASRYPIAYQTVDVVIFNDDKTKMLMAKKPNEKLWRFVGGFSEPTSPSLEYDVKKEAMEEANVEVGDIQYVGSLIVDDVRYRNETDKIKTAIFQCKYLFGKPDGDDDIAFVKWFNVSDVKKDYITIIERVHRPLVAMLIEKNVI